MTKRDLETQRNMIRAYSHQRMITELHTVRHLQESPRLRMILDEAIRRFADIDATS